ncbi:tetratricopeptide repeat protein [Rheinheimera sp.]|uniref:tetratricopeptide repeat protein n=1 Tax=Rheinheimera sp. TaxID=1869214 RepID=UPI003D2CCE60
MQTENLTILFVDIAGFTATTNRQSRRQNASLLQNFESLLKPQIKKFSGQLVKSIGDALLLSFRSPTDAMLCACRMQDRLALYRQQHPDEHPIVIRIAAHLGEVRIARHDIFGEAVNLAARIEAVTPPGEIYLSEAVYLAMNKTEVPVEVASKFTPDGFDHEIQLYKVRKSNESQLPYGCDPSTIIPLKSKIGYAYALAGMMICILSSFIWFSNQPMAQNKSVPIIPPELPVQFVRVSVHPTDAAIFSPELQSEMKQQLEHAVRHSDGFYPSDEYTHNSAVDTVEVTVKAGNFPKPSVVTLQLKGKREKLQLDWDTTQSEALLQQSAHFVQSVLTNKPIDAPKYKQRLAPDVFQQYLKAKDLYLTGKQLMQAAPYWQALTILTHEMPQILEFQPAVTCLCNTALALQKLDEPESKLETALQQCSSLSGAKDADALLAYGNYLMHSNNFEQAEAAFNHAITQDPGLADAYSALASLYQQQGEQLEAERIYQLAIRKQPNHWHPLQALAVFHLERGRFEESLRLFQQVVQLLPDNSTALTNLGTVYLLQGQLQAAAETYQNALRLGNDADTQSNLATVYYYLGRLSESIHLYKKALEQSPERYELHGNLADALRQSGAKDAAQRSYKQALSLLLKRQQLDARELALKAHYSDFLQDSRATLWMEEARSLDAENAEVWLLSAQMYLRHQDKNNATLAASKAVEFGFSFKLLSIDPDLSAIANDRNFQKFLQHERSAL